MNEIADGQLDWYFESVPPDRLTQLKAQYPKQVHPFTRNNIHVLLDERAQVPVQQAGGARGGQLRDRPARAGQDLRRPGQRPPRTSSRPASARPTSGTRSTRTTWPRRRQLIQQAGVEGAHVTVWGHNTDPTPTRCSTWPACSTRSASTRRVKTWTSRCTGTRSPPRRATPRSRSTTGTRTSPRAQDFIDVAAERRAHRQRGQQRPLEHEHPRLQQA